MPKTPNFSNTTIKYSVTKTIQSKCWYTIKLGLISLIIGSLGCCSDLYSAATISKKNETTTANQNKIQLAPHKAQYEVFVINSKDPTLNVQENEPLGTASIEVTHPTPSDTSYQMQLKLQFGFNDGTTDVVVKNVAFYESAESFSFHTETFRNGSPDSNTDGEATKIATGWLVSFQNPMIEGFSENNNLLFPISYLIKILDAVNKKQLVLSDQMVFDPTNNLFRPNSVNATIAPIPNKTINISNATVDTKTLWKVRQAIYQMNSPTSVADQEESTMMVLPNGIIVSMESTLEDGSTIKFVLKDLVNYQ